MTTPLPTATHHIAELSVSSDAPVFLVILGVHIAASLLCLVAGLGAMFSAKGPGRHARFGSVYCGALAATCGTAVVLVPFSFADHWPLLILALAAGIGAFLGVRHRHRRLPGDTGHIVPMGLSYIALLTAFYVDNGKSLPLWRDLPTVVYWVLPSLVGAPLIARAVSRAARGQVEVTRSDQDVVSR